jgi:hypothetical protein
MKHILYFFDARKDSRIDLFWARSDVYVVNFDLFVFIEGVIFQKGHSYFKVVVCYGHFRIQRFLMISSHLHRNLQFWNLFYLVTKTSNQLLFMRPRGSGSETSETFNFWMVSPLHEQLQHVFPCYSWSKTECLRYCIKFGYQNSLMMC